MTENECLDRMVAPGTPRPGKYRSGVIQIHITRACDKACFNCTQGSNLGGKIEFMTVRNFEICVLSLRGYFGVNAVFGGNPALSPHFEDYCDILKKYVPKNQCGIWCNHPKGKARIMRETFDPSISNLNVHLDRGAYDEFKKDWPESQPVGLTSDSRHAPPYVALKDVVSDESERWELISKCEINQHWSAMLCQFRGDVRAYFCEIAGSQAMLHQHESDYPDLGLPVVPGWWKLPMNNPWIAQQVRKHCHDCGVPLKGYGELAQASDDHAKEQVSQTHADIYKPKRKGRSVELVMTRSQLGKPLDRFVDYLGNSKR